MITRRNFLVYLGAGSYSMLRSNSLSAAILPKLSSIKKRAGRGFEPIKASTQDALIVPKGFRYDIIASVGDKLESRGPYGEESFGCDNDFTCLFETSPNAGLLWVNHEVADPRMLYDWWGDREKTKENIITEKLSMGGSIIHVERKKGKWMRVSGPHTRRLTALYPEFIVTGPLSKKYGKMTGTLANCSGGKTLWGTVLSCEENFEDWNSTAELWHGHWRKNKESMIDENQFGYVIEVDPTGILPPVKHSALGRFNHENAAMTLAPSGQVTVYMGDDSQDQYLYKFVSREKFMATASAAENQKLLHDGTLYVANMESGKWLALDVEQNKKLKEKGFKSQAEVMLDTRGAAKVLGATPLDRPEDCEVHPLDGTVYIAFTNNKKHGNFYGQIVRLLEKDGNAASEKFSFEIFLTGGPQSGLASPDNLLFDKKGNLWVVCDISANAMGAEGAYATFGNNGLYLIATSGKDFGKAHQFASAPVAAEFTGPWMNEKQDTLFLSVQHPGQNATSPEKLTSHWPRGEKSFPLSSVVAISGF